ncbi:MAG: hypothetical protein HYV63_28365 [Candidatus Schekmanbacteria bacterium]|nr:hypothetical protein [Candidatus Schekmanbacteria bacterium]
MPPSSSAARRLLSAAIATVLGLVGSTLAAAHTPTTELIAIRTSCETAAQCRAVSRELARIGFTTLLALGDDVRVGRVTSPPARGRAALRLPRITATSRPADFAGRVASLLLAGRDSPDREPSVFDGSRDHYAGIRGAALVADSIVADGRLSTFQKLANVLDLAALSRQNFRSTMSGANGYLLTFIQSPAEEGEVWSEEEIELYTSYAAQALLAWTSVADPALALSFRLDVRSPFTDPEITNIDTYIWDEAGDAYEEGIWIRSVTENAGFYHPNRSYTYDVKLYNDAYRQAVNASVDPSERLAQSFSAFYVRTENHAPTWSSPTWPHVNTLSWVAYAVLSGSSNRGINSEKVTAHETGHLYWALDEYASACETTEETIAAVADQIVAALTAHSIDHTAWVDALESAAMSIAMSPNCEVGASCIMNHNSFHNWVNGLAPVVGYWTGQEIWGQVWAANHPTVELSVNRESQVVEAVQIDGVSVGDSPLVRYVPEGEHTICRGSEPTCDTVDVAVESADRETGVVCGRSVDVSAAGIAVLDPCSE